MKTVIFTISAMIASAFAALALLARLLGLPHPALLLLAGLAAYLLWDYLRRTAPGG